MDSTFSLYVFLVLSVAAFFYQVWRVYKGVLTLQWKPVSGVVELATVRDKAPIDYGDKTRYAIDVYYHYEIRGKKYSSNKLGYVSHNELSKNKADNLLDKYAARKKVIVYVSPMDSSQSVLIRGTSTEEKIKLVLALLAIITFSYLLLR